MVVSRSVFLLAGVVAGAIGVRAQSDAPRDSVPTVAAVFFPPTSPIYGAAIAERHATAARLLQGRRLVAPDGLADFVCDPFYPALSTRLFLLDLNAKLEARLHGYRARRLEQVNALLNQFVALHDLPEEVQEQQLREFARAQTPLLVALETEADQLQEDLIADGIRNRVNWDARRRWRLGSIKSGANGADAEAEFQVVRATAFYQKGLAPQQRGLLRELAIDLESVARKARGLPVRRGDSDAMFFSPETARFRLPPELPPALRERIGLYNGQKAELKRELRETVAASEKMKATERTQAFEALADKQWPQLGELEKLADEIRTLLAARFAVAAPAPPPWIPPGFLATIRAYNEDRDDYFADLRGEIERAVSAIPQPDTSGSPDERVQRQREYVVKVAEARRQSTMEFQERNADRFAALEQRHNAIRSGLTTIAEKQTDRKTGRPLNADTLLRQYAASMEEFDTFGRAAVIYTNYRIAMLQPGLSPEQRRLLFGYALIGLAQPLPHGELMPQRNATRPYPSSS